MRAVADLEQFACRCWGDDKELIDCPDNTGWPTSMLVLVFLIGLAVGAGLAALVFWKADGWALHWAPATEHEADDTGDSSA
jgi:hypothetical protein